MNEERIDCIRKILKLSGEKVNAFNACTAIAGVSNVEFEKAVAAIYELIYGN